MLSLEELGMTPANLARYETAIKRAHGCAIITGPTGSGKSTTLYSSALRVVTDERKFISIEDPVEYRLPGITQIDVSGYGEQALTFSTALRAVLRSDPDIILVGEIRDQETAKTAVEAALTGHFLYSTLHTNDALSAISRLLRLGIEPFLTAEAVAVLVAQRLVRRLCDECKVSYEASPEILRGLQAPASFIESGQSLQLFQATPGGCEACRRQGYRGRTGVHEVITMSEELKTLIIAGTPQEELTRLVRSQGMHSLRDDAFLKVAAGITSVDELARVIGLGTSTTEADAELSDPDLTPPLL
jgi:type IV pilus assembly protein PilB